MQFYKYKVNVDNKDVSTTSFLQSKKMQKAIWVVKISSVAFVLSFLLSIFSELFLINSNVLFALILLISFMMLNIYSDMLGLAITSCQVAQVREAHLKREESVMCIFLIKNSDKVSSVLCDVIGDACGILCGVSGSILSIMLSTNIYFSNVITGAVVSSIVVALTVLFKAIAKSYAVNNSLKIVKKTSRFILRFKKIMCLKRKQKNR